MKQNRLKKIVLIAALSAALQPVTSQCFSWGNLFAGCQSKVSGLLAAAQANKTKATLIVGGTSIVALALGTCLYKWFFSKKDEYNEIPPVPDGDINNWKPSSNSDNKKVDKQKTTQKKIVPNKKQTSTKILPNLGITFDPRAVTLTKTNNLANLNNKKTEPEYEKKQTDFRGVLKKQKVDTNFVPTSQLGDSSTSKLINKNKPTLPTNNIETPK